MTVKVVILVVLTSLAEADVSVDGDITFSLNMPAAAPKVFRSRSENRSRADELVKQRVDMVTVAPVVECLYQYPEKKQIDELLSNMMNQLTRVFVKVHVLLSDDLRRKHGTRFIVINEKHTDFFDNIFDNMTTEYRKIQDKTTSRVNRAEKNKDPCTNQEEIKQMWKDLLEGSLGTFRRAAARCIERHLRARAVGPQSRARDRLGRFLVKEVAKVRVSQLGLLCDNFQLCFNDLL